MSMCERVYVRALVAVDESGHCCPRNITMDGVTYQVDRVLQVRQAAATRAGGQGLRYTVRIRGQQTYLFQDEAQRWFVEGKR